MVTWRVRNEPYFIYRAVARRVIDGDTVELDIDLGFGSWLHARPIRLLGVLAPETRGPERAEGMMAKAELERLLPVGSEVVLRSSKDGKDKYGRYLGDITRVSPHLAVNEAMNAFVSTIGRSPK